MSIDHSFYSIEVSRQDILVSDLLIARNVLSSASLERVVRLNVESGERIDRIAIKLGLASEADLAGIYAELLGSPLLAGSELPMEPVCPDRLSVMFAPGVDGGAKAAVG